MIGALLPLSRAILASGTFPSLTSRDCVFQLTVCPYLNLKAKMASSNATEVSVWDTGSHKRTIDECLRLVRKFDDSSTKQSLISLLEEALQQSADRKANVRVLEEEVDKLAKQCTIRDVQINILNRHLEESKIEILTTKPNIIGKQLRDWTLLLQKERKNLEQLKDRIQERKEKLMGGNLEAEFNRAKNSIVDLEGQLKKAIQEKRMVKEDEFIAWGQLKAKEREIAETRLEIGDWTTPGSRRRIDVEAET